MPRPPEQNPNDLHHYCRWCIAEFAYDPNQASSPHMRAVQHAYFAHRQRRLPAACTRSCLLRQQPEEKSQNRKLYGAGAPQLPAPKLRAEDLGAEDEHA